MSKPRCKLSGKDGNVFFIMGLVAKTLKQAKQKELAEEFLAKAQKCRNYDEVIALTFDYVDVF